MRGAAGALRLPALQPGVTLWDFVGWVSAATMLYGERDVVGFCRVGKRSAPTML